MRIKITFSNPHKETQIPINTNYYLVSLIDNLTFEYRRYLQSLLGAAQHQGKFDLYTFSQLLVPKRKIIENKISILSSEFHWFIASPFHQFLGLIAKQLRNRKTIKLYKHHFGVRSIQFVDAPEFHAAEARFTCLSPVAVYRQRRMGKKRNSMHLKSGYILPNDRDYLSFIKKDLMHKYQLIENNSIDDMDFELQYDAEYIRKRNNRITKVITLENGDRIPEQVRGVLAPLKVKADPQILRIIYDSGLGQLNNLGFGMLETVHTQQVI